MTGGVGPWAEAERYRSKELALAVALAVIEGKTATIARQERQIGDMHRGHERTKRKLRDARKRLRALGVRP